MCIPYTFELCVALRSAMKEGGGGHISNYQGLRACGYKSALEGKNHLQYNKRPRR